ncbi:MAG: tetratricopeptide repeat protein [Phycisphaerae bacterium]
MPQWETLKDRAAGKWQLPLLLLSLVMLAGVLLRVRPTPARLPLSEAVEYLDTLVSGGFYDRAIEFGDFLLIREQSTDADRAPVHLQLARARYGSAERKGIRIADAGRQIIDHYQHAASRAQKVGSAHPTQTTLTGNDYENMGRALEWQGEFVSAVEHFKTALERGVKHPMDLRRHVLALMLDRLETSPEQSNELLDRFLADVGDDRLDLAFWAIERKLDIYEALGRLEEAATLLTRHRERFHASDLRDRFSYLEAWLLYKTGHYDEAETHLRTVRNRVEQVNEVHAMTGWLLGCVVMSDDGPQRPLEALSFFEDVITHHPDGPYAVASRLGLAEALAMLEHHEEALDAYRIAIEELTAPADQRLVNLDALRTSLAVRAETQRVAGRLGESVAYARLATALVDRNNIEQTTLHLQQLAQVLSLFAARRDERPSEDCAPSDQPREASRDESRALNAEAAATYLELAQVNALNERIAASSSWRAAELYAMAGERDRAAKLYRAYATERPENPLVPRALLRIGQIGQASGRLAAAIEAYQECYRRFPRTLDGSRALVPLVQCYLAMGPDYEDLAEKTLRVVLESSEVFTPQAPEFASALFLLGEVVNRHGEFERAIATLEEALARYPNDPRAGKTRFLLADSFRRSGLALRAEIAEAMSAGEIKQIHDESTARFQAAQQLYRELITEYELRDPATLNRLERVYLRHATLYEADCYFETRNYRRALKLYEEAAGTYKDTPRALAAHVQIINSHVFLGQPEEARAALARALVLVDAIPNEAFDTLVSPETRKDWKRYFDWLGRSELF